MDKNDENWREGVFAHLVEDNKIHRMAFEMAKTVQQPDGPLISEMDLMSARRYLRAAIMRMTHHEVRGLVAEDAAALWARGAIGAAAYRRKKTRS